LHIEEDDGHAEVMRRIIEREVAADPRAEAAIVGAADAAIGARVRFFQGLTRPEERAGSPDHAPSVRPTVGEPAVFTSRHFAATGDSLQATLPERLLHPDVDGSRDGEFSGERGHAVSIVDLPSRTLSVTIGTVDPGGRTRKHRHSYETVIYVLEGRGRTTIEDRVVDWEPGDAIYVPVWAWHHHSNRSQKAPCRYLACENAPLLQNLGGLAIRQEAQD
jgi:gentisate 1,2-dioxygenase